MAQPDAFENLFVSKVTVRRPRRFRSIDGFVLAGWALILVKCLLASAAIRHWDIPIDDFYVWGPSIMFGALCTGLYLFFGHEE
ncbi:MAG: hypothetical protein ACREIA_23165 [Opitutaceae bacterium]